MSITRNPLINMQKLVLCQKCLYLIRPTNAGTDKEKISAIKSIT